MIEKRTMAFIILLYSLMAIGPYSINTAAVPPVNNLFNAINSSCSNASILLTKQKEIFQNCQSFAEINQPMSLTNDNAQHILCMLYANRIISYCESKPKQIEYPTISEVINKKYEVLEICNNITEYSNNTIKEFACFHLCTALPDIINPECLLSHYYNNLLNSTTNASRIPNVTPMGNSQQLVETANKPDLEHLKAIDASKEKQGTPKDLIHTQGGDSNIIDNHSQSKVPKGAEIHAGGNKLPDEEESKPNGIAESKPDQVAKIEGKSPDKEPPTDGQSPDNQPPIQKPNADQPKIESQPGKPNTNAVAPPETQDVPPVDQPPETPTEPKNSLDVPIDPKKSLQKPNEPKKSLEKPNEPKKSLEKPIETQQSLDKPSEPKKSLKKPEKNDQNAVIDGSAVASKIADEPKENLNPPELENGAGDTDIDDGEGQHGVPEQEDYSGLAVGGNFPDDGIAQPSAQEAKQKISEKKPDTLQGNPVSSDNIDEIDGESYFMSYFMIVCVLIIVGYVGYHNRIKVMALLLEGKRNRRPNRGRRPNSANYHKLDSNLEEAISSNVTKNSNNVIY